ncbi:hypothetical protein I313_05510 [Cryptococcus deuterogattii Ram5]|uniref:Store-operated calcium entry-associated regulatory factor n=1 Tax=Cryptococcus deuterogattii Ram5 TaxID=1296110 RepID=A0A0D0SYU1_9TREE|nr:hypothetical protein I313_05510 [Cryptococcus deuterogattii Ram5]
MRRTNGGAKKIPLSGIKTLTFYADKYTAGRRTSPIPQLTCQGPGCKIFQPDVVQCTNMGDDGLGNVQWKCDTDLPSSLRLGKVDVSCEGWSAKGDPDILQVNKGLEYGEDPYSTLPSHYYSLFNKAFNVVFYLVTLIIVYNLLRALLGRYAGWRLPRLWPLGGGGGGGGGGWGGGGGGDGGGDGGGGGGWGRGPGFGGGQPPPPPPPPYTKHAQTPTQPIFTQPPQTQAAQAQAGQGTWWNPGFWTGLAAGGLGAWLVNNRTNNNNNYRARQREDGYRGFLPRRGLFAGREDDWGRGMRFRRVVDDGDDDNEPWGRGARTGGGGGGGGEMRRATGFGGTSSR